MKTLIRCAILTASITQILIGGAISKHQEWRNDILILTYNNTTKMFPGWTSDAHYFWNSGTELSQSTSTSQTDDFIISTVNNHRTKLSSHARIIKSLDDQIESLIAINKKMLGELDRMHILAFTRVWTDIDGNSFTGVFIEYDLGAVKVRKVLDDTIYTIPAGRLTPACKEMALALNKFN